MARPRNGSVFRLLNVIAAALLFSGGGMTSRSAATDYACPWSLRLMPGQSTFTVSSYSMPGGFTSLQNFQAFIASLQSTGLANGFDAFIAPDPANQPYFDDLKTLGWASISYPVTYPDGMWTPGAQAVTSAQRKSWRPWTSPMGWRQPSVASGTPTFRDITPFPPRSKRPTTTSRHTSRDAWRPTKADSTA